jgi:hypothetical protein
MTRPDSYIYRQRDLNRLARAVLQDLLAKGPQPYQVIHEQAVAQGISKSALLTAKWALNVRSTRVNGHHI